MKEQKFDSYFGRRIAVDASMHIYQFMAVVRLLLALSGAGWPTTAGLVSPGLMILNSLPHSLQVGRVGDQLLTNEAGDVTSHLQVGLVKSRVE